MDKICLNFQISCFHLWFRFYVRPGARIPTKSPQWLRRDAGSIPIRPPGSGSFSELETRQSDPVHGLSNKSTSRVFRKQRLPQGWWFRIFIKTFSTQSESHCGLVSKCKTKGKNVRADYCQACDWSVDTNPGFSLVDIEARAFLDKGKKNLWKPAKPGPRWWRSWSIHPNTWSQLPMQKVFVGVSAILWVDPTPEAALFQGGGCQEIGSSTGCCRSCSRDICQSNSCQCWIQVWMSDLTLNLGPKFWQRNNE